jgi:acyl-CoA synthetase (AMP-forming)/AMP-acid ligase II
MRRMEKITGRSDDMMIIRGVNVFPTQIEELILKRPELSPHYQCVLTREGPDGQPEGGGGNARRASTPPASRRARPPSCCSTRSRSTSAAASRSS